MRSDSGVEMVKRRTMDDVFARMGEMNAARTPLEPEAAAEAVEAAPIPEPEPAAVIAPETVEPATQDKPETGSTRARSHVEKERLAKETRPAKVPKGFNVRPPRIEQPHQSVYADPAVFKVIRQIALAEDKKPQDLYREALRAMLKKRGYDFDKLNRGEA